MSIDPLQQESSRIVLVDWRRVLFWSSLAGTIPLGCALVAMGVSWMPIVPKGLGRTLTEGFLRTFLVGYFTSSVVSVILAAALAGIVLTNRRDLFRRKSLARLLLSGSTLLVCLIVAELTAYGWLAWIHRFPKLPTQFPEVATSRGRDLSLVVIGGSAALGYPYNPHLSIGQIVGRELERAIPGKTVRVNILAGMGANLEQMHQKLSRLERRPDAILIHAGNNEFLSRFESDRNADLSEAPLNPILGPLYELSLRSPLCRLVYETTSKNRLGGKPTPVVHHRLIDPPAFTPSEFAGVLNDFHQRLEAIVAYCDQVGAVPILVIPASNESGYEPNRNVLPDRVSHADRDVLTKQFESARALEESSPARAIELYRELAERRPELAEVHFRLGRLLESAGNWTEARRHYLAAKEHDGFPIRVLDVFQDAYRDVARRHGCILVDGPKVFQTVSPHGIVGDDLLHDAHHPTARGHATLAQAVVRALQDRREFDWPTEFSQPVTIDLADCLAHFAITAKVWDGVCAYSATFYRDLANLRFDPSERKAKQDAYEAVRPKLEAGESPDQLGIPGMGLVPPGSLPVKWWQR